MERYAAFLRGINVGGHVVKMETLRRQFEALGFSDVTTFIASGNVFFASSEPPAELEPHIEAGLRAALGYEVATFVRTAGELVAAAARTPFATIERTADDRLYVVFMRSVPDASVHERIARHANPRDLLELHGRELLWLSRGSLLESSLSYADWGGLLGTTVTTVRNANTLRRMAARLSVTDRPAAASRRPAG